MDWLPGSDVNNEDEKNKYRTSITKSDVAVERLDKILFNYPDMQAAFAPLYSEIRNRDRYWKHRGKKGDDDFTDKAQNFQKRLRKRTMAFMLGWIEKKYKDEDVTNVAKQLKELTTEQLKYITDDERKYWFEAGEKYRQAQEKIEGHDTNDGTYYQIEMVTFQLLKLLVFNVDSGD